MHFDFYYFSLLVTPGFANLKANFLLNNRDNIAHISLLLLNDRIA